MNDLSQPMSDAELEEAMRQMKQTKFPSTLEIVGGVIGAIPFLISFSQSSLQTDNGTVTDFVYRDWLAVGCGVIAAALGAFALTWLRRTQPSKRIARVALALGLVALGSFQIARGFGLVAVERPPSEPMGAPTEAPVAEAAAVPTEAPVAEAAAAPTRDEEQALWAVSERFLARLGAGKIDEILADTHPRLLSGTSAAEAGEIIRKLNTMLGTFTRLGTIEVTPMDGTWQAVAKAQFAAGFAEFELQFVKEGDQLRLSFFQFNNLSDDTEREPD